MNTWKLIACVTLSQFLTFSAAGAASENRDSLPTGDIGGTELTLTCATHRFIDDLGDDCDPLDTANKNNCRGTCGETRLVPLLPARGLLVSLENGQAVTLDYESKRTFWLRYGEQLRQSGSVTFKLNQQTTK